MPTRNPAPGRSAASLLGAAILAAALMAPALRADEGMWTFDHPPTARIRAALGFAPDQAWLDHQRLAALRFPGGSGAFVSADGLVLTNHHVAHRLAGEAGRRRATTTSGTAYLAQDQVRRAAGAGAGPAHPGGHGERHRGPWSGPCPGTPPEPGPTRPGGRPWTAWCGRRRSARAWPASRSPSTRGARPGSTVSGSTTTCAWSWPPSTTWPPSARNGTTSPSPGTTWTSACSGSTRDGAPLRPGHHLRWSRTGLRNGDPTFVVGHPARTARQETLAQMEAARDVLNPHQGARGLERAPGGPARLRRPGPGAGPAGDRPDPGPGEPAQDPAGTRPRA